MFDVGCSMFDESNRKLSGYLIFVARLSHCECRASNTQPKSALHPTSNIQYPTHDFYNLAGNARRRHAFSHRNVAGRLVFRCRLANQKTRRKSGARLAHGFVLDVGFGSFEFRAVAVYGLDNWQPNLRKSRHFAAGFRVASRISVFLVRRRDFTVADARSRPRLRNART